MSFAARAAVIGCGDISAIHFDALAKLGIGVDAVCDLIPQRAQAAARATGATPYTDYRSLLNASDADVIHVCTPHATHTDIASAALADQRHVLVEKPLDASLAKAEAFAGAVAAREPKQKCGLILQNRYNRPNRRLKELLDTGQLGTIYGAHATLAWHRTPEYYQASEWRGRWDQAGGGLLMNQAIHTLDLLVWLLGPVKETFGHAGSYGLSETIEVEDTAQLLLRHRDGATSTLAATNCYPINAPITVSVHGEAGHAVMSGDLEVNWHDGRSERTPQDDPATVGRAYWGDSHRWLFEDFYRSLGSDEPFWIGPDIGVGLQRIISTIYESSPQLMR